MSIKAVHELMRYGSFHQRSNSGVEQVGASCPRSSTVTNVAKARPQEPLSRVPTANGTAQWQRARSVAAHRKAALQNSGTLSG